MKRLNLKFVKIGTKFEVQVNVRSNQYYINKTKQETPNFLNILTANITL